MHFWSCCSAFLLFIAPGYALYNGNPALPKIPEEGFFIAKEAVLSLRGGYEGDLIFNRKMGPHANKFKIFENFGALTFNFDEKVDLYADFGSFYAEIRKSDDLRRLQFQTRDGLTWKVGARAILWDYGETFLTLHVAYQNAWAGFREIVLNGSPLARKGGRLFYQEVEGSLSVGHQIDIFIPYLGIEGSYARAKLHHLPMEQIELHSRSPVGLFLGSGFSPGSKLMLNVEIRLIDDEAVALSGEIRF
ncbi:MAG: hypothetical protein ACHQT8_01905 [Chlamydiales bacterium]